MTTDFKQKCSKIWQGVRTHWLEAVTAPFVATPGLMLTILAMLTAVPYICTQYYWRACGPNIWSGVPAFLGVSLITAWLMLEVYTLLGLWRRGVAKAWLAVCMTALTLNWAIDLLLGRIYGYYNPSDIVSVFAASNVEEASGFLSTYLKWPLFFTALKCLVMFALIYLGGSWLSRRVKRLTPRVVRMLRRVSVGVLVAAFVTANLFISNFLTEAALWRKGLWFRGIEVGHEIVPAHPRLIVDDSDTPAHIVVVIGESHSRSHSSLYGYGKCTQPRQQSLVADSSLYVFASPTAPGVNTIKCFQYIIGTWQGESDRNWYECPTFLEVADSAGYKTVWLSNQSAKGVFDNPVTRIAEFADIHKFTNDGMRGISSSDYDEDVLGLIDRYGYSRRRDLTVIHLMGSHILYSARYPEEFGRFKATDYGDRPEHQRGTLAAYDNSLLYNDYILSEIYRRYEDRDAVVVYLSDHSQDLYESSPDYVGHANESVAESRAVSMAVPFTVWLSPRFKAAHPQVASRIAAATGRPVATTDLIYALMDLMGARFADSDDVAARSFFRPL